MEWTRKSHRQFIADRISYFKSLPYEKAVQIQKIITSHKKDKFGKANINKIKKILGLEYLSWQDFELLVYAFSGKYVLDWIDRNLEKAPSNLELVADGFGSDFKVIVASYKDDAVVIDGQVSEESNKKQKLKEDKNDKSKQKN